ncbi:MAG: S49 family peptidase [Alphaproteobacteria bacterium]|nr:S49 family peptidase [Alphaproteobacteria bacterium]
MGIFKSGKKTIPVIRLEGVIGGSARGRNAALNLESLRESIDKAFAVKSAPFVGLAINSPGGSPVQSALIGNYIRQQAEKNQKEVYAFCEDVAASGGYWLAASADKIYVMHASIIGSIGVIASMFGFTDLIKKIGVERRVYTSGGQKNQLDPFMPEQKEQIDHLKTLQASIHQDFIEWVKTRRADKLIADKIIDGEIIADKSTDDKLTDADLFSGKFWDGAAAKKLGLVDEIGGLDDVLYAKYGKKYHIKFFNQPKKGFLRFLGADLSTGMLQSVEERAHWERFGL